ncbi:MAG: hypothetical protein FJ284_04005 [Planctomycetes bacterium]|nr:hypothetical protein [Planctomycetota bacterium]
MFARRILRRAVAWAMLGLHGLVASGLPLPVTLPAAAASRTLADKDRSRPFPCMDTPCGCESAERCFSHCCCHTPTEMLRWAETQGVEPAVIAALRRRVGEPPHVAVAGGCCAARSAEPSCGAADEADGDPICNAESCGAETSGRGVSLRAMLACGGIVSEWTALGVAVSPPAPASCELPRPAIGPVVVADDYVSRAGEPLDPPPPRVL